MKNVLVDSGFIIALYDKKDDLHKDATKFFAQYFKNTRNVLLIAWPVLYESISTQMVKNRACIKVINHDWKVLWQKRRLIYVDDSDFREKAIGKVFEELNRNPMHYRKISLVDRVLREMLSDLRLKIDIFKSYNKGDFNDVCKRFRRELL